MFLASAICHLPSAVCHLPSVFPRPTMQIPTMKTHARLAALGAVGVCVGAIALFGLFYAISGTGPGSGLDFEHSIITRISVGVIVGCGV